MVFVAGPTVVTGTSVAIGMIALVAMMPVISGIVVVVIKATVESQAWPVIIWSVRGRIATVIRIWFNITSAKCA
jgi:hypothetical protein